MIEIYFFLLVQAAIVECGVQKYKVSTHLLVVEHIAHPLDVLVDSLVDASVALFLVVLCSTTPRPATSS